MQKTLSVIDLSALRQNAGYVRSLLGQKKFYAVVKADAYGHGGPQTALAIEDIADGFCVSITEEGAELRLAGITKPILVFTPPLDGDDISRAAMYGLTPTVNSARTAAAIGNMPCHIKINTGMNRYGCTLKELPQILAVLRKEQIVGVYSHLFCPQSRDMSQQQLKLFNSAEALVKQKAPNAIAHLAASGGLLAGGYLKDGARCGILLYGYAPVGFSAPVRPVLTVYARRAQQTEFIGGGAGYAPANKQYTRLNTYRLGYADGFMRTRPLGENFLCMDAFVKEGGGEWEPVLTNADEYAQRCGTISYEVLCSAARRSRRIYEQGPTAPKD